VKRTGASLLEKLLLRDVEEGIDEGGALTASIKKGTAPGRIPSATDPHVRHRPNLASTARATQQVVDQMPAPFPICSTNLRPK
jgi:hypothetical protein